MEFDRCILYKRLQRRREFCENWFIYGKKVQHNGEAGWIKNQYQQNPSMKWSPICAKDVAEALRTTLNWKAPGRDQIPNFWLKQLTATHRHIAAKIREWLTAGVTFHIPKNENTENPKNYRPVTCLPTMYKHITSVISRRMQKYMDDENLIPKEQKGCYRGSKGYKDQLLISKAILQQCKRRKKIWLWYGLIIRKLLTGCHTAG